MKINNKFHVPLPPEKVWVVLNDVPRVAQCVPGAKLLEQQGDNTYIGTVSVRLGPVALSFKGTITYNEIDAQNYRVRASATGNEQRARGAARAEIVFQLAPDDAGTIVNVDTDLQLVGAIAQYGRGGTLIENTAQILMEQFAKNLAAEFAGGEGASAPAGAPAPEGASAPESTSASVHGKKAAKEISGLTLIFLGLRRAIARWFNRLLRREK